MEPCEERRGRSRLALGISVWVPSVPTPECLSDLAKVLLTDGCVVTIYRASVEGTVLTGGWEDSASSPQPWLLPPLPPLPPLDTPLKKTDACLCWYQLQTAS